VAAFAPHPTLRATPDQVQGRLFSPLRGEKEDLIIHFGVQNGSNRVKHYT
jgi:hypothetical protein